MGKDLIEGAGTGESCNVVDPSNPEEIALDPNNLCKSRSDTTQACPSEGQGQECACVLVDPGGDPCSTNPCQHGGTCTSVVLTCDLRPTGYTGDNCEIEPSDPCSTVLHGGTCLIHHTCDCPTGYTGDNCEIEPSDPCSTNPCQHGGTCTSTVVLIPVTVLQVIQVIIVK